MGAGRDPPGRARKVERFCLRGGVGSVPAEARAEVGCFPVRSGEFPQQVMV